MALQLLDQLITVISDINYCDDLIVNKEEIIELVSDKLHIFKNVIIKENGILTCKGGKLYIQCMNDMILESDASIDLNYKGYISDKGIGKGIDGGGASYATKGTDGWNTGDAGVVYGDILDMGSGGGSWGDHRGGSGGGYIEIEIGKDGKLMLDQNSKICVNGENGMDTEYVYASGAGSGGCIHIQCNSIQSIVMKDKTASITAIGGKGGKGRCYSGGDGGDGKIQIIVKIKDDELTDMIKTQITPRPEIVMCS